MRRKQSTKLNEMIISWICGHMYIPSSVSLGLYKPINRVTNCLAGIKGVSSQSLHYLCSIPNDGVSELMLVNKL